MARDAFPDITGAHFAFLDHRKIKAASAAGMKAFRHIGSVKPYAELVARHARLGDFDHCAADAKLIADVDR